jgi:hypothetical protein
MIQLKHSSNIRDSIRHYVLSEFTYHDFTPRLCKYLREFKRYSMDVYCTIHIVLPNLATLEFETPNRTGAELTLTIPQWPGVVPPEFQKYRWWKLF